MPVPPQNKRRHLLPTGTSTSSPFTAHAANGGDRTVVPDLPRQQHGRALQAQIERLQAVAVAAQTEQAALGLSSGLGVQIQFVSQPNVELAVQSLSAERGNPRNHIELLSVRQEGEQTFASVFVPEGKLAHFEGYVADYLGEKKNKAGRPLDHKPLINTIAAIQPIEIRTLWTDEPELLPKDPDEGFWWEVWLPVRGNRNAVIGDFKALMQRAGCQVTDKQTDFPERTVMLMYGSQNQVKTSLLSLNCVAEFRRAKETADFFDTMGVEEQRDWQQDLIQRTHLAAAEDAPRLCLLDSGVNRGHELLAPLMAEDDMYSVEKDGRTDDEANHGTGMAGLGAYGDLTEAIASNAPIAIYHRLESVRLLREAGANAGEPELHGQLFGEAVSRPEISYPDRKRIFCSAVTASDYRDRGRPSSWSAKVDSLAADADNAGQFPRLFVLSAGNTNDTNAWNAYPDSLSTNLIHDPGQAWNALTVGACTAKTTAHAGYEAIAEEGGLSPYSTTSAAWQSAWPLKPDVVMEGGNVARDNFGAVGMDSLQLLSAHHLPHERVFTTFNATSAAAALCGKLASEIAAEYPQMRPETIRALIVHSAEWTEGMRKAYLPAAQPGKAAYARLIRHCGWGEPSLDRALWSASNSLTLVIEDALRPYKKERGGGPASREMNLHALPWPREELEALQGLPVQMRVTLSYFIEPNPSARGSVSKYHYPSHRLRFDVQRPLDATTAAFVARVNAAVERDDEDALNAADADWYLGDRQRHRGSLHQDVWEGTAAELASRGVLAVYPAPGWWRTRPGLERFDSVANYSLIVSIRTEQNQVDLYNAIANQIAIVNQV
ncbi:S8 family peptidase [Cupriavidus alkaliphilus]|uniref:S8 family peptidase n=1 Tax=Cupriavidus alkaliphilus TaxID=942866 RepID=UPI00339D5F3E